MTALELAKKLLDKGADPNARIAWKEMPMTKGLGTTKNPPNINLGRHYLSFVGSTPFYNAARNGDAPMMRLLVEHGADPKIADRGRRHAADGRRLPRLLRRRNARPADRRVAKPSVWKP